MSFVYRHTIRFHETDAAGRLFFAEQFKLAHDAYEAFLSESSLSLHEIVRSAPYVLPIVHAEADYRAPLFAGDEVEIRITAGPMGETSFSLNYDLHKLGGGAVGTARTVHVAVSKEHGKAVALPTELRGVLGKLAAV